MDSSADFASQNYPKPEENQMNAKDHISHVTFSGSQMKVDLQEWNLAQVEVGKWILSKIDE